MGFCQVTAKCLLLFLGLVFWAAACACMFIGAWVYNSYKHYDEIATSTYTLIPASIILGVGAFLFLIGLVGCIAACKEHRCLLGTFFSLLLIVLSAEIAAGALAYVYRHKIHDVLRDGIHDGLNEYQNSSTFTHEIDYLQRNVKCCGIDNATDWIKTEFYKFNNSVPESCCINENNCTQRSVTSQSIPADIQQEGCLAKIEREFRHFLIVIVIVAIAFAVIQLLGLIGSCVLFCRTNDDGNYSLLDNRGYRV